MEAKDRCRPGAVTSTHPGRKDRCRRETQTGLENDGHELSGHRKQSEEYTEIGERTVE
jgi:hypothetical protein